MKSETLNALITARLLLDSAEDLCRSNDRNIASAGLIILQDALELVFYGSLVEIGASDEKGIEKLSFDQLIGELRLQGHPVQRSGTLKALNRERVNTKHYGQLAEPVTVQNYLGVAQASIAALLRSVIGRDLTEVHLNDLLEDGAEKPYIDAAVVAFVGERFSDCLVEIRKAIYVAIEEDYSIEKWRDYRIGDATGLLGLMDRGGYKAPWRTRNAEWIETNVKDPTDYVQVDMDNMRLDLLDWGASTRDYNDVARLTPKVFRFAGTERWVIEWHEPATLESQHVPLVRFCLDRSISLLIKRQSYLSGKHIPRPAGLRLVFGSVLQRQPVYHKAAVGSPVETYLEEGAIVMVHSIVDGFESGARFARISEFGVPDRFLLGYVPEDALDIQPAEEILPPKTGSGTEHGT
jgi:hypothetical protein